MQNKNKKWSAGQANRLTPQQLVATRGGNHTGGEGSTTTGTGGGGTGSNGSGEVGQSSGGTPPPPMG